MKTISLAFILFGFALLPVPANALLRMPDKDGMERLSLIRLREVLPNGAVVIAPWDFEYLSRQDPDLTAYHQTREAEYFPVTYLTAKAYASGTPETAYALLRFIVAKTDFTPGHRPLKDVSALVTEWESGKFPQNFSNSVYVLFSESMAEAFKTLFFVGGWDLASGKGLWDGYKKLDCFPTQDPNSLRCSAFRVDLSTGLAHEDATRNSWAFLSRTILIEDGRVVKNSTHPNREALWTLEAFFRGGKLEKTLILDEAHYRSAFNQMFLLGREDARFFERIPGDFPGLRVFRLRGD